MTQTNGIRTSSRYSVLDGARKATGALRKAAAEQLSPSILQHLEAVTLTTTTDGTQIYFPCPFKETEALVALKSVEASVVAAIAAERFNQDESKRKIEIDLERTAAFGFSTYIATIGGFGKQDAKVKSKLKGSHTSTDRRQFTLADTKFVDTDLLKAQSILYRRLSANLYATKNPGEYFHIHGSLEGSTTLRMIGLEPYRPDLTDYRECLDTIESHVKQFTTAELETMNAKERQAGVTTLKWDDFKRTNHVSCCSRVSFLEEQNLIS
jgi:hypothetical protein